MTGLKEKRKKDKSTGKVNNKRVNKLAKKKPLLNRNSYKLPLILCKKQIKK